MGSHFQTQNLDSQGPGSHVILQPCSLIFKNVVYLPKSYLVRLVTLIMGSKGAKKGPGVVLEPQPCILAKTLFTKVAGVDHWFGPQIQIWKDLGLVCFWSHGASLSRGVYKMKVVVLIHYWELVTCFGPQIQILKDLAPMCFWSHGPSLSRGVYNTKDVVYVPNRYLVLTSNSFISIVHDHGDRSISGYLNILKSSN